MVKHIIERREKMKNCTMGLMVFFISSGLFYISIMNARAQAKGLPELNTVKKVELQKYLGKWYEIATLKGIISRLEAQGYDFSKFTRTNQKDFHR
jgi:hypothetical protein